MVLFSDLTGLIALSGFMWFLTCFCPSAGAPSGPLDLTVEVLDFDARVLWKPAPENPSNCTYVVELQKFGEQKWIKIEKCTSTLTCDLGHLGSSEAKLKHYFVRVKATCDNESSEWTNASSFQPFSETLFRPPSLNVRVKEGSIFGNIHHPLKGKIRGLEFDIYLFRNDSGQKKQVALPKVSEGNFSFHNLPIGRYCVRASVNSMRDQVSTEKCVVLHTAERWPTLRVTMGLSVLVVIPVGLIVISVLCYRYLKPKKVRPPTVLKIVVEKPNVLEIKPDIPRAVTVSQQTLECKDDLVLKYEGINITLLATSHKSSTTSARETNSLYTKQSICLTSDDEDGDFVDGEDDDADDAAANECIGSTFISAGYGLAPDSSDEDTQVEEENGRSGVYMDRLIVGVQWQVHVQPNLSSNESARGTESPLSTEEATETETYPSGASHYEPRPSIFCHASDADNDQ
ncbi:hypothetical protein ACEWY4_009827 [Coilia grayii]|uniref:Fibronectin type-III domain-containing protein n=1 Tax=Coilia grayii TaxID=363190 RepID=A0ABD1K7I6_9TELE